MSKNFYSGEYKVINKEKFLGEKNPQYRSSWESRMCFFLIIPQVLLNGVMRF
jgi:hypothetical protein